MSYITRNVYDLGPPYAGKTLNAQIVDDTGTNVGAAISSTFREVAVGKFEHVCSIPDGQVGFLRIYTIDAPSTFVVVLPINSIEIEANAVQSEVTEALTAFGVATSLDVSNISTIVAANNPPSIDVGKITLRRASTFDCQITNVSVIPSDWQYALFTVKEGLNIRDSKSILQIKVTNGGSASDGLKILGGKSTGITQSDASMTVDYSSKIVTIHIEDHSTVLLSTNNVGFLYDIKFFNGTSDSVATSPSRFVVIDAVTEEV